MQRILPLFLMIPAAMAVVPKSASAQNVFPYPVQRETLDNGMKIIVIPMKSEGLVSYWSVVRTGSRDEVEKGVTGFAHFFEHMMFHGGRKFPGKKYDETVNSLGADQNASTWDDKTVYHLSIAKEDLATVIDLESDRFQFLTYDEGEFKTESGAVHGEYRKGRTSPFEVLQEAMQEAAFDVHTYRHTVIGYESDIKDMPNQYKYSKTFFERFYRPENVTVCVAGDVDPKAAFAMIREKYSNWKKGYVTPDVKPEPAQTKQRRIKVAFDGQTLPILAIGFKGERFLPDDRTMQAGRLLDDLCFGETSPLYKKLVLGEQRVESLQTDFDNKRDPGLWTVYALVKDAADAPNVEKEIFGALADIAKNGVPESRLKEVISRVKYQFLTSLSTPGNVNERIAPYVALTGDMDCIETMYKTRDKLTVDDIKKAANLYFTNERSTVAVLRSKGDNAPAGDDGPVATAHGTSVPLAPGSMMMMDVPNDPNIVIKLWFKVGSQNDPPGKEGLASLTGSLLGEGGSKSLPYDQILEKLFPMAANYGSSVDREMTVLTGFTHRDHTDAFVRLFGDAVANPGFRKEDFERLRDRAVNAIEKNLRYSSDEELGKAVLYNSIFEGTPYGPYVDGTVAGLKAITLDDVKSFYREYYTRNNLQVAIGGTKPADFGVAVGAALANLPTGGHDPVARSIPNSFEGRHVTIVQKPGPSTAISFGFPIDLARGTKDFYALSVARSWLGEHRNSFSHLYQVIREKRGMNYGDYAYIEAFPAGGFLSMPPTGVGRRSQIFEVWVRPVPEKNGLFALRAALREVEQLVQSGMSKEEFERGRSFLSKYSLHFAESTADRLGYAIDDKFYGTENHLKQFRSAMQSVTLEDVNAAIKKYLQIKNIKIAIVTEHAADLRDAIAADAPSSVSYPSEKGADILAEDKIIERHPLHVPAANIRIVPVDAVFEK
ncbi:MAG: insulinase family protein [Planctomycetes bacterium]|nr:insulinase family protein [Planctomycetota bacterium]